MPVKLSQDLQSQRWIHAKGWLFLLMGVAGAGILLAESPRWQTWVLLAIIIWAFCRFYYYLFYVLERYLGREQRFSGVLDALRYLLQRQSQQKERQD